MHLMSCDSTSFEPLSSSSDETRQRSALEKGVVPETVVKEINAEEDNIKEETELIKGSNSNIKSKAKSEKYIANLRAIQNSEKLDIKTIQFSLLFYVLLFLTSKYINSSFQVFYQLSYNYPNDDNSYDIGLNDIYFTIFWIINLIFLRSFLIIYLFKPCAKLLGIKKFVATQRFIEQSWSIIYYVLSWGFGFYLYYKSDYFFNCYNIYANWPHDKLSSEFKFYYLVQTANWFQQCIVIFLEARRKDHIQMVSHHIITILLCTGSYISYFTRIGHIILLIMDIVDVFLSGAKILKYCGFQTICDVMFVIFMVVWIILRHGVYVYVLWFSWIKARDIMDMNCAKFLPGQFVKACYTDFQIDFLLILLAFLQIIMCIWMYMILRVAIRVISGGPADDVRSDSEE